MIADVSKAADTLGLIAGNGRFPFLLLDAARAHGLRVVIAALREETDAEIEVRAAADPMIRVHWLSLGELSRLIEIFHREGVARATMAGQVKHKQIFSSIRPDWRLAKLLLSLGTRSTDSLLGAIAKVLADEGITLISSTAYLEPLLAKAGVLTARKPEAHELADIVYGRGIAKHLAAVDLGQTVVVAAGACVAIEAMEGTDATILRAGELVRSLDEDDGSSTLRRALTVVKVAKPNQDMRFDVPVIGVRTVESMRLAGATCLAIEAGRTLLFDPDAVRAAADAAGASQSRQSKIGHVQRRRTQRSSGDTSDLRKKEVLYAQSCLRRSSWCSCPLPACCACRGRDTCRRGTGAGLHAALAAG